MAKANQKFKHPLEIFNRPTPLSLKDVRLRDKARKKRKRKEQKQINKEKFRLPRYFKKVDKTDSFDKNSKQIQNGFDVAKRLMSEVIE